MVDFRMVSSKGYSGQKFWIREWKHVILNKINTISLQAVTMDLLMDLSWLLLTLMY